jgi:hypothetical protein
MGEGAAFGGELLWQALMLTSRARRSTFAFNIEILAS